MSTKHTPGPLAVDRSRIRYEKDGHYKSGLVLLGDDGEAAIVELCAHQAPQEAEANAERLKACWNACEGINPEAVPELVRALENAGNVLAALAVQDLKALKPDSPALRQIRAALSKAKGGSNG